MSRRSPEPASKKKDGQPRRFKLLSLDTLLTSLFIVQLAIFLTLFLDRKTLFEFWAYCFVAGLVIQGCKAFSFNLAVKVLEIKSGQMGKKLEEATKNKNHERIQMNASKFAEQSWQLLVHVFGASFSYYILSKEDFTWMTMPNALDVLYTEPYPDDLRVFFLAQLAVWFYTGFSCRFFEERRKDYYVMMGHHVITICAIMQAWYTGCIRYGMAVLYVHDTSDIVIDSMKMFNYLGLEGSRYFFLTEGTFVFNFLTWIYFRFYKFFFLWHNVLLGNSGDVWATQNRIPFDSHLAAKLGGSWLLLLQCMHIWWFYLLLRVFYKIINKGNNSTHSVAGENYEGRSDDEKDD